jgi:hypothetical protein
MNRRFMEDIENYTLTQEEVDLIERVNAAMRGEAVSDVPTIQEFTALPSAQILLPKVIIGAVRRAAEPIYLGKKLLKTVRTKNSGQVYVFPAIGPIRAYDVAEGQEIPAESVDVQTYEGTLEVRIGKVGVRVQVTRELIEDSMWDIVAMMLEEAGRALARHKEQKIFREFSKHGWTVFDNSLDANAYPEAHTTGLGKDGNPNGTMSVEDFLDLILAVMANEFTPTTLIMHPLTWSAFARSEIAGLLTFGAKWYFGSPEMPQKFEIGPESIQGRIPFGLEVLLSPFVPFDKEAKKFDMYCVDRDNVGILLVREDIRTQEFDNPARDIRDIKLTERYGIGILHKGRAIAVAKNITLDASWPEPPRIKTV